MYLYIYIHIHMYIHITVYIYIYINEYVSTSIYTVFHMFPGCMSCSLYTLSITFKPAPCM